MKNSVFKLSLVSLYSLCLVLLGYGSISEAFGMAEEKFGPEPGALAQPGAPYGLVEMYRHPARVYSFWVNGNETFYYQANAKQIAELVTLFSDARLRDHVVVIVDPAPGRTSFTKENITYNASLQVVDGIALWHARTQVAEGKDTNLPLSPVLTIYAQSNSELLKSIKWENHLVIQNRSSNIDLISPAELPKRDLYWGGLEFDDGSPASDFVTSMQARLTLWEEGEEHPINLASVDNKGRFSILFSAEEMQALREGVSYMTLTLSNYLTLPKREDFRFPIAQLSGHSDQVETVRIASPKYYWGRLLFEDDIPFRLDPAPWQGAAISVSFPFAGSVEPDENGYFRVLLSDSQRDELLKRKAGKNIYIPSYTEPNRSKALHVFPSALLNEDKEKAGVVRIDHPATAKVNH